MKLNLDFKKMWPDAAAIVLFAIITFVLFNPLFDNKQLKQSDINQYKYMSKEIADYREKTGEEALWTNSMFGGMPAYQISVYYGHNFLSFVDKYVMKLGLPVPANYFFLYMVGFFILFRVLKIDPWVSVVAAIAFAFSSYFVVILEAGHNSKANAIGYMAPTLAFIILTFRGHYIKGGILATLFLSLELHANHPQITYYLGLIILIFGAVELVKAIKEKTIANFAKATGISVIALTIGLLVNLGLYMTTLEYSPYTIRGKAELSFDSHLKSAGGLDKDYATQWSYGKGESWSLLIPNAKGGASGYLGQNPDALKNADPQFRQNLAQQNAYWGDQPGTSGPVYVGAIVVFFFILGLFIVKSELKWVLLIATILSITLAWGKNMMWLTDIFMDYVPGYNKFRAVSMILVIAQLSMALLAFLAVWELFKNPDTFKTSKKYVFISLGLSGGVALIFALMPGAFFSFLSQMEIAQLAQLKLEDAANAMAYQNFFADLEAARKSIFAADAWRSTVLILVAFGLLWIFGSGKLPKQAFIGLLGFLILIDMAPVVGRYLTDKNYERKSNGKNILQPSTADLQILEDKDLSYRVFNLTENLVQDASTSYFHKSIGGYHGAKLRRYQDLIEYHIGKFNLEVIGMLNTKYFIQSTQDGQLMAIPNSSALGNAWFASNIRWVNTPDQEITLLGKVIVIENIGENYGFNIYGRELKPNDTMMISVPIELKTKLGKDKKPLQLDLSRLELKAGETYIIGNNPTDTTPNFVNVGGSEAGDILGKQQFKATVVSTFNPRHDVIIDKQFKAAVGDFKPTNNLEGSITLDEYKPNNLKYSFKSAFDQMVVFSEIYYPKGWNAYIDGKLVEHFRVDYVLRGLVVPKGDHKIEFKFEPTSYKIGSMVTTIASAIVVLGVLAYLISLLVRKQDDAKAK